MVTFQICFFMFTPDPWGEMVQIDDVIFFKWVGEKPLTRCGWLCHPKRYDRNISGSERRSVELVSLLLEIATWCRYLLDKK